MLKDKFTRGRTHDLAPENSPNDSPNQYLDLVCDLSKQIATHTLDVIYNYSYPFKLVNYLYPKVGKLFDNDFCDELTKNLDTEIRDNYLRLTDTKLQDRYTRILKSKLEGSHSIHSFDLSLEVNYSVMSDLYVKLEKFMSALRVQHGFGEGFRSFGTEEWKEFSRRPDYRHYCDEFSELEFVTYRIAEWVRIIEQYISIYSDEVPQHQPAEPDSKGESTNVRLLLVLQTGILDGTFHKLPVEKQYDVLPILLGKSRANIKNALTAYFDNANSDKNPCNLPNVVQRANDLIMEYQLGVQPIKKRKER